MVTRTIVPGSGLDLSREDTRAVGHSGPAHAFSPQPCLQLYESIPSPYTPEAPKLSNVTVSLSGDYVLGRQRTASTV